MNKNVTGKGLNSEFSIEWLRKLVVIKVIQKKFCGFVYKEWPTFSEIFKQFPGFENYFSICDL